jgi:hypothetical protein
VRRREGESRAGFIYPSADLTPPEYAVYQAFSSIIVVAAGRFELHFLRPFSVFELQRTDNAIREP